MASQTVDFHGPVGLRPFGRHDFDRLIGWVPTEDFLMQWAGPIFHWPLTRKQLDAYLEPAEASPPTRRIWTVLDGEAGEPVGHIELNDIDRRHRSATMSRVLVGPGERRGRGVGRRMVEAALAAGFRDLGLHRIDLRVFDFNAAAIACYEKAGFRKEGLLRECRLLGGRWLSVWVMAVLDMEWSGAPTSA